MAGLLDYITEAAKAQYAKGAPYRNALGGLLSGDMTALQELNKPSPVMPNEALDVAMAFAPMGITKAVGGKFPLTDFEVKQLTAQRNATLPVAEGGLGLPASNTAMDRAKALGFDTPAYHGTPYQDFSEFKSSEIGKNFGIDKKGFHFTSSPNRASDYASYDELGMPIMDSGHVIPTYLNMNYPYVQNVKGNQNKLIENYDKNSEYYLDLLNNEGYGGALFKGDNNNKTMVVLDPNQIRSRFAAFDPFRRNEADILAGVGVGVPVASGLLDIEDKKVPKKEKKKTK
jgi:hypothetical protein